MTNILDSHLRAYQGKLPFDFDNFIQLKWYPSRVMKLAPKAKSLLELGLGYGITTDLFSHHFRRHVVLDGSPAVIDKFRQEHPDSSVEVVETLFEQYETQERFDLIVMGFVLEHVDDPSLILEHFRKFLKPGGMVFTAVPNAESLNRRLGHIAGLLPDIHELSDHDRLLGHRRYYTVDSFRTDAERVGYRVISMEGIYLKPFTSAQIHSLKLPDSVINALCIVGIDYPELSCGILTQLAA